ncbi:MAG: AfsR/SARP family transcriptional regulator, partial [Actinomycetota bacterium]
MARAGDANRVRYRLLGPLEVVQKNGRLVELGGAKERLLLALLLLEPNRVLSVSRLIDDLWGEAPPESANVSLRVLVSHLRKALSAAGETEALVTRAPGYVLNVSADQVDALRFEDLAMRGHNELAEGDAHAAATTLRDALALWHGAALGGLGESPAVAAAA